MAQEQRADPETQFDTDLMILDYLLCKTVKQIIAERNAQRSGSENDERDTESSLGTFDVFCTLFQGRHPTNKVPEDIQLKLKILTFANLFCRRYRVSAYLPSEQTLKSQRKQSAERARSWLQQNKGQDIHIHKGNSHSPILSASFLANNHRDILAHLRMPYENATPRHEASVSLLDLLPEYMALCDVVPADVKHLWMHEAVVFMFHAAAEQVMVYGNGSTGIVDEAFAWGWANNGLGIDTDTADSRDWESWKRSLKAELPLKVDAPGAEQVRTLLSRFPLFDFEGRVLELLEHLVADVLDEFRPILMQLEEGTLAGLTTQETKEFMNRLGIST